MPCLITALNRSAIRKTTGKKTNKISKYKNLTAKTQYLKLKAHSNKVKMQSDKTLTKQLYFFLTKQLMSFFPNENR